MNLYFCIASGVVFCCDTKIVMDSQEVVVGSHGEPAGCYDCCVCCVSLR